MSEKKLHIDGTDEFGCYQGGVEYGPYVVFDENTQQNVAGPFRYRWMALIARYFILRKKKP